MNSPKKTWFAFPYILWIIGFTLIPLGLVLYYAFTGADGSFTLANVLAITELGYRPRFSMEQGIAITGQWLREHGKNNRI